MDLPPTRAVKKSRDEYKNWDEYYHEHYVISFPTPSCIAMNEKLCKKIKGYDKYKNIFYNIYGHYFGEVCSIDLCYKCDKALKAEFFHRMLKDDYGGYSYKEKPDDVELIIKHSIYTSYMYFCSNECCKIFVDENFTDRLNIVNLDYLNVKTLSC
jgi:hypothetical protein